MSTWRNNRSKAELMNVLAHLTEEEWEREDRKRAAEIYQRIFHLFTGSPLSMSKWEMQETKRRADREKT